SRVSFDKIRNGTIRGFRKPTHVGCNDGTTARYRFNHRYPEAFIERWVDQCRGGAIGEGQIPIIELGAHDTTAGGRQLRAQRLQVRPVTDAKEVEIDVPDSADGIEEQSEIIMALAMYCGPNQDIKQSRQPKSGSHQVLNGSCTGCNGLR